MRIGIFDSGYGGLTVYRSIHERLPEYDYFYLGDNARTPYGHRSFETVLRFTTEAVRSLFDRDCALIVIACNTSSAKALRSIQQQVLPRLHAERRVLGIIRPAVEALAADRGTGPVAIWGTPGTVKSQSYAIELERLAPELRLVQLACPLLVPLVENGELEGPGLEYFLRKYWAQTLAQAEPGGVGKLFLACTHYPLLQREIQAVVGDDVKVLAQGEIVADSLKDYLERHPELETRLERGGTTRFLTTDQTEGFDTLGASILGRAVVSERVELG